MNIWLVVASLATGQLILVAIYLSNISRRLDRIANALDRLAQKDATTS